MENLSQVLELSISTVNLFFGVNTVRNLVISPSHVNIASVLRICLHINKQDNHYDHVPEGDSKNLSPN